AEKHQPGSIVRVKLTNFVTYTAAEFHPGPSLNMIIGPNGTGKSTLVCAICLGLGWGPQHLGRASDIAEFVKHGSREAEIKIELAAGPQTQDRNPIIRRRIKKEGSKTNWSIDGRSSTLKDVQKLCKSFSIQIDNLCQFLPQDRVVEFAGLSPVELLAQTQRAAAPEYMTEWHDELKKLRNEQKKTQAEQVTTKETFTNLEGRQNLQRAGVERLRERGEIQARIAALERMRPLALYRVSKAKYDDAKERRKVALREMKELEEEVAPSLRAVNAKQDYQAQIERVVKQRKRLVERAESQADELQRKYEALGSKIDDCETQKKSELSGDKTRKLEVVRVERSISNIKNQMRQEPIEFDAAAFNEQIRHVRYAADIKPAMQTIQEQALERRRRITHAEEELKSLHSHAGQQTHKLHSMSRDTARAWDWVKKPENQELFEGRVYGPPIVECSVKDPIYADAIESMMSKAEMLAFTTTNKADYKKLSDQLYGTMNLTDINIRDQHAELAQYNTPVSSQELSRYGLEGWALDYISGPEPVVAMLCETRRLHQAGVTLKTMNDQQYEALCNSPIASWVTKTQSYVITRRREYGPKAVSTRVRDVRKAQYWTAQPVDHSVEAELRVRISEAQDEINELQQSSEGLKSRQASLKVEHDRLKGEKKDLETEKNAKQTALSTFKALPVKLAGAEEKLASLEEAGAKLKTLLLSIADEADKLTLEKGQLALDYVSAVDMLRKFHFDLFEAEILYIEASSDVEVFTARNQDVKNMLEEKRRHIQTIDREYEHQKNVAKAALAEANKVLKDRTAEEEQLHLSMPEQTPEELEVEIESAQARLELVHEGNPNIIRDFEARQKRIETLQEKLEGLDNTLRDLEAKIVEVRTKWEPELDAVIQQISEAFSHSFSTIGAAGQVVVWKDDDFDQWAVHIQVKFRDGEALSLLDSHRQSGGERAVSTIFYLMALQSLARAPFRVVDEINQGMDPRNERLVHERMVDIACEEHTSQYFLITPKLLSGLKFHKRMKVHCIASGEYMPKDSKELEFGRLVERALRLKAAG
ncbi:hypothetical protein LTR04_001870, partial [Oleoguttula sp. CCFEE 6159]